MKRTEGEEVILDVHVGGADDEDADGAGAVLRRGHPEIVGLDVVAAGEDQVLPLAVLQREALDAHVLAVLEVERHGGDLVLAVRGAVLVLASPRPPLLAPAVDDAAAAERQVPHAGEVEPPALVAVLPSNLSRSQMFEYMMGTSVDVAYGDIQLWKKNMQWSPNIRRNFRRT